MNDKVIYLTKERLAELQKECEDLTKIRRPEVVDRVSTARNMGDLSENAEYVAAREELSFIDGRIDELEQIIKQAQIIEPEHTKGSKQGGVELGSKVTLNVNGKREEFMIVGEWEADPKEKKISHQSPLGKSLLGKVVGEKVEVAAPAGKIIYTIIKVH